MHLHDLHDGAVRILHMESEFDGVCRSEAMLLQDLGRRISVESLRADSEVIDQSWRILLAQRHQCTVHACSASAETQNPVGLVFADGCQTKDATVKVCRTLQVGDEDG